MSSSLVAQIVVGGRGSTKDECFLSSIEIFPANTSCKGVIPNLPGPRWGNVNSSLDSNLSRNYWFLYKGLFYFSIQVWPQCLDDIGEEDSGMRGIQSEQVRLQGLCLLATGAASPILEFYLCHQVSNRFLSLFACLGTWSCSVLNFKVN